MTKLQGVTYKELQGIAKENGIHANQSDEKLRVLIGALVDSGVIKITAGQINEENQPSEEELTLADVFGRFVPKEYKSHKDLEFVGYVSDGLAKFAFELYQRHGLDVKELNGMAWVQVKAEVDRLSALPFPPSQKQLQAINTVIDELQELNPEFDVPMEVLQSLTGGQDGTAGQFLQFLYQQRNEFAEHAPLSDSQADKLLEWFFCPDIPWDDYNLVLKKPYPTELNPNGWVFVEPGEFKAQLKLNMTKVQASEFIGAHKDKYYDWKRTRINDFQFDTIRKLEDRMSSIGKLGVKTFAIVDGVVQEVYKAPKKDWNPNAYEPMAEFHLRQMSKEDASKYIKQLESEVSYREKSAIEDDSMQRDLEQKRENLKPASDNVNSVTKEYQALVDLVFALEAVAGQENEDLHESISELMIHKRGDAIEVANKLYEFMNMLIEKGFIRIANLVEMAQHSHTATRIIEIKYPKQYDEAINGKGSKVTQVQEQKEKATEKANNTVANFMNQFKK